MAHVTVVADLEAAAATAAARVTSLIQQSIIARGNAVVCLTGGRTVRRLYELLAEDHSIEWTRVHVFWSDERHVPPDDPQSNVGMAQQTLLAHVPIPATQVHRMQGELRDATAAARAYDSTLREGFALAGRTDHTCDVMLLSLGEDAHIASIFPGSPLLGSLVPLVAAVWVDHLKAWRITLTPAALVDARAILVLASGGSKAEAVRAALELPEDVAHWPAQLLRPAGDQVEWVIDREAAARLSAIR